jgi:hypothetical protein
MAAMLIFTWPVQAAAEPHRAGAAAFWQSMILVFTAMPVFRNGHYANPSLHLDGATIKNDHHGQTDKEMHLSLSVRLLIKGDVAATHYMIYICMYSLDAFTCSVNKQRYYHGQMWLIS